MEISREPARILRSAAHPLAERDRLTLDDLAERKVLIIRRGWNHVTDAIADELRGSGRDIEVEEFPFINVDIFNRCVESSELLVGIDPWETVHPLLVAKPLDWDYALPFGIMHASDPTDYVRKLLDAVADVVGKQ